LTHIRAHAHLIHIFDTIIDIFVMFSVDCQKNGHHLIMLIITFLKLWTLLIEQGNWKMTC